MVPKADLLECELLVQVPVSRCTAFGYVQNANKFVTFETVLRAIAHPFDPDLLANRDFYQNLFCVVTIDQTPKKKQDVVAAEDAVRRTSLVPVAFPIICFHNRELAFALLEQTSFTTPIQSCILKDLVQNFSYE